MSEYPLQCTIKPPLQWANAPWLNFQAEDQSSLEGQLREAFPTVEGDTVAALAAKAFVEYAAILNVVLTPAQEAVAASVSAQPVAPQPQHQSAPAVAAAGPAGPPAPFCIHGTKVHRSGEKNGREWSAWFCPSPKGTPDQCKADFGGK